MAEPIDFATASAHLRLAGDTSEQALVESYIAAAREYVENYTGHILFQREMTDTFRSFTAYLELTKRPVLIDVDHPLTIAYTDTDGAPQTIASFITTDRRYPLRVYPAFNEWWPPIQANTLVEVTYTAGYAPGEEPHALLQAILLLVGHWFERRSAVSDNSPVEVPMAVTALCDQYRTPGL